MTFLPFLIITPSPLLWTLLDLLPGSQIHFQVFCLYSQRVLDQTGLAKDVSKFNVARPPWGGKVAAVFSGSLISALHANHLSALGTLSLKGSLTKRAGKWDYLGHVWRGLTWDQASLHSTDSEHKDLQEREGSCDLPEKKKASTGFNTFANIMKALCHCNTSPAHSVWWPDTMRLQKSQGFIIHPFSALPLLWILLPSDVQQPLESHRFPFPSLNLAYVKSPSGGIPSPHLPFLSAPCSSSLAGSLSCFSELIWCTTRG